LEIPQLRLETEDATKDKAGQKNRRILVYFVFKREVQITQDANLPIPVDINENNVTVKVDNKVFVLFSDIKKVTLGYSRYREIMQSINGNDHIKRNLRNNEKNKKKDRRFKIANIIVNTAKQLRGVVVLEKLPKKCPENMIRNIHNKKLRHRTYQAGFRTLLKTIIEKCEEKGVLYIR